MIINRDELPVLVLGGTGYYGRYIVKRLLNNRQKVRVLTRNVEYARSILGEQINLIEGDITDRTSIAEAINNVGAVVIAISAFSPGLIRKLKEIEHDSILNVIEEMQNSGVHRLIYISVYDLKIDLIEQVNHETGRIKVLVEKAIKESSLNWTILGAPPSMEIFFAMIRGGKMTVPGGGPTGIPTISAHDVGEIAAQTVIRDDLAGKRIRMVGPRALSFPEATEIIVSLTKENITFRKIPLLPLKIASFLAGPFFPYIKHLVSSVKMLNLFPQDIVADVTKDHQWLLDNFDYAPRCFEDEVRAYYDVKK